MPSFPSWIFVDLFVIFIFHLSSPACFIFFSNTARSGSLGLDHVLAHTDLYSIREGSMVTVLGGFGRSEKPFPIYCVLERVVRANSSDIFVEVDVDRICEESLPSLIESFQGQNVIRRSMFTRTLVPPESFRLVKDSGISSLSFSPLSSPLPIQSIWDEFFWDEI